MHYFIFTNSEYMHYVLKFDFQILFFIILISMDLNVTFPGQLEEIEDLGGFIPLFGDFDFYYKTSPSIIDIEGCSQSRKCS